MNETYYKQHLCCPRCGGRSITRNTLSSTGELLDRNNAVCDCGWKGIVHDLVPAPAETSEEPLTITSLLFKLRHRVSRLSEEKTRTRLVKYRKLVKEYIELVNTNLNDMNLIAVEAAHVVAKRIQETGDKTPSDDEITQLSVLCGPRIDIPENCETLYTALHGPGA